MNYYNKSEEQQIKNPFNNNNILVSSNSINSILSKYNVDYKIKSLPLFQEAMTHKSYIFKSFYTKPMLDAFRFEIHNGNTLDKSIYLQKRSYERLEFLGDSILKTIISNYIYKRYPNEYEGFLTSLKIKLENKHNFSMLSKRMGLDQFILLSQSTEHALTRSNLTLLEDVFEAFVGALFCDINNIDPSDLDLLNYKNLNFTICNTFVINLFEEEIDFSELLNRNDNYKSRLLHYYHSIKWSPPKYKILSNTGMTNNSIFKVGVFDNNNKIIATGTGRSKVAAEQLCSKNALSFFKQL